MKELWRVRMKISFKGVARFIAQLEFVSKQNFRLA